MPVLVSRDTKSDFETPLGQVVTVNLSTEHRPDALSPDYRTAFTYGPLNLGDTANGVLQKIWKATATTGSGTTTVDIIREDMAGYSTSSTLFSFNHVASGTLQEIDFCFSTDTRPVVCAELSNAQSSSIFLYWFNPFSAAFEFKRFVTSGSTPRLIIDNTDPRLQSDVLLFYMSGSQNEVKFLQQRDQYNVVRSIPLPVTASAFEHTYIEDVVKLDDSRVAIFYSRRNTSSSRWEMYRLESVLYPYYVQEDALQSSISFVSGVLRDASFFVNHTGSLNNHALLFASNSLIITSQSWNQTLFKYIHTGSNANHTMVFDSSSLQIVSQSWERTLLTASFGDTMLSSSVSVVTSSLLNTLIPISYPVDTIVSSSALLLTASLV